MRLNLKKCKCVRLKNVQWTCSPIYPHFSGVPISLLQISSYQGANLLHTALFPQLLNRRGPQCTAVPPCVPFFVAKISSCQPVISGSISLLTHQSEKICVAILHYRPIIYHLRMEIVKEDLIPCSGDLSMVAEICFIVKPIPLNPIGNVAQSKANMKNF